MKKAACFIASLLYILSAYAKEAGTPANHFKWINPSGKHYFDPTDSVGYSGSALCPGDSLVLTINYDSAGSTYQWKQNGAPIVGATGKTLTVKAAGTYSADVTRGGVTVAWPAVTVTMNQKPVANFTYTQPNSCGSSPVSFTSTSTGAGLTYQWFFDDFLSGADSISGLQNPTHYFIGGSISGTQTFKVSLTVTNSFGCIDTISKLITTVSPSTALNGPSSINYNGLSYFRRCTTQPSATLDFSNNSGNTNLEYRIVWGDGSPDFSTTSFTTIQSHTYNVGNYRLWFIVTGANNCKDTGYYNVFVGSNPAVGLNKPANADICTGSSLTFPISGTENNPPGTTYTITFNDGSASQTFPHPAPPSVIHTFLMGSCNAPNNVLFPNSFTATLIATNPCSSSPAIVSAIYVSQKNDIAIQIAPKDTVCVNVPVTISNPANTGTSVENGKCIPARSIWNITPTTGWTLTSGSFGNGISQTPTDWTTGTGSLVVNFSIPGTYTIKLKSGNDPCGADSITKTICINPAPTAAFSVSGTVGCAPYSVKTTNNSNSPLCGSNTYTWSVGYTNSSNCSPNTTPAFSYINGTGPDSPNPEFNFTNPGTYIITLITRNSNGICSATTSQTITVKTKPAVTFAAPPAICQNGSYSPTSTVNNCYATTAATYQWTFSGGNPSSSTSAVPGAITYLTAGTHTITLAVTNECGTTTITQNIVVKPLPDVVLPQNMKFCTGATVPGTVFTSFFPGTTYAWTNSTTSIGLAAGGSGNLPAFNATNNGSSPVVATITVTPTLNGCTGPSQSFSITVNPKPLAPVVTTPVTYCQNTAAIPLTATALANHVLNWYTTSTGGTGSTTAPTPSTTTVGTVNYYVSQTDMTTGCEGPRALIAVTVKTSPVITNATGNNPTSCGGTNGSIVLSGLAANTSYSVSYVKNGNTVTATLTSNASGVITLLGLSSGTYSNITVTVNGCPSNSMGPVSLSDPNPPATPTAGSNGPLCSTSTLNLTANSTTAGVTYTWSGPNSFSSNLQNPGISNVTVAASGTYSVTATLAGCTSAAGTVDVTINPKPATPVITANSPVCTGNPINLTANSTTAGVSYSWTGPNSFASSTQNPSIANAILADGGTYTVTVGTGICTSTASTTVVVRPTPNIGASSSTDPTNCASATGSITLQGLTAGSSYTVNYTKDATPVSATISANSSGAVVIQNLTAGSYSNISVTLNGCPSNLVGPFTLTDPNPPAAPVVTANSPVCTGGTLNLGATTTSAGTATWSWAGPNAFTSTAQNPSIANATAAANGTYTVTVTIAGCTSTGTVTATINPKPARPSVVRPVVYCLNGMADSLKATALADHTLTWYNNTALNNGSLLPLVPSTATAGTFNFYVTQTNSFGCASDTAVIPVTVYDVIKNNTISAPQTLCSGNTPAALTGQSVSGGNNLYTYQWQQSTDGGTTWTNISGATSAGYAPPGLFNTTLYRRLVSSGPCMNDSSNAVTITIQGTLASIDITAAQVICAGATPALLNGQSPTGGDNTYAFQWQQSTNGGSTWTDIGGATAKDYQPTALTTTTQFRRKTTSGPCSAISNVITITVNPVPVMTPVSNVMYCNGSTASAVNFSSNPSANVMYTWTNDNTNTGLAANGIGNIASFTAVNSSNPKVPLTSKIDVIPTYTANGLGCPGITQTFTVTVLPTIVIDPIKDTVVCTGSNMPAYTPVHDAGTFAGSSVTYKWTVSGSGITLVNGNGTQLPAFNTINTGAADLVATVTLTPQYSFGGKTCDGTPVTFTVTTKSATPAASAGPDTTLCASPTYTMLAAASSGTSGLWTQIGGPPATITSPAQGNTSVTGLQPLNTYQFVWTVTGFANCPATKDTITIKVVNELLNNIDTAAQTICAGQSVVVNGPLPSGGNGGYVYQWQSSADRVNWTNMSGHTGATLSFSPATTVYVRRLVTSLPCTSASLTAQIFVQPPISNNTISANDSICINTAAKTLQGSQPAGANGSYLYQWQSSPDGIVWTDIAGATTQNYSPGVLSVTTHFRRKAASNLCNGPQSSTSNAVVITINPDAQVLIAPPADTACAPFNVNAAAINLTHLPTKNSTYQWYANGVLLGTSLTFPGYTITNPADSVKIRIVAISRYGCLPDSITHTFYTKPEPSPAFTISDTVGCGPLVVRFNNTTANINQFNYRWDFGNGQTSTLQQPPAITFLSNPTFGDTTYTVKLSAFSACTTLSLSQTIRVKSKPKALFIPNATVGCSPMQVTFNNTSRGLGNAYTWNFGDGSAPVSTTATGNINHMFVTAVRDTFYVKMIAENDCGKDSSTFAIVVAPNSIRLGIAVNGNEQSGCAPHAVSFINNSAGGSTFTWNFGDGTVINTSRNLDTVKHTFIQPGTYVVSIRATNGCSDTSTTQTIVVYPKPKPLFTASNYTLCIGDSVKFTNASDSATSYFWQFGDGGTSSAIHPVHIYRSPGLFDVKITALRFNAPGSICSDSLTQQVRVVASLPGIFALSDTVGYCTPFTVTFTNQSLPAVTATWDFGDGTTGSGNNVQHTYTRAGLYTVRLTSIAPGGCTYTATKTVRVASPDGTWSHNIGYLCRGAASFSVNAMNTDSLLFDFGDGVRLATTNNIVFHTYQNAGVYYPTVLLKSASGCTVLLPGIDSIRVENIKGGFTVSQQKVCGYTTANFTDTSLVFFGRSSVRWDFGDGTNANGFAVAHNYTASGSYPVRMIVTGRSGCRDTVTKQIDVFVNEKPSASITGDTVSCVRYTPTFTANIQSTDVVSVKQWTLSNGVKGTGNTFSYTFALAGTYTLQLVVGTVNGCYDTAFHTIKVNPSPNVNASADITLCRGGSAPLNVIGSGVASYAWQPLQGLSCYTCTNPVASPLITTPYLAQGTNSFGCVATDTVVVTVIQPLKMTTSPNDSICIGQSINLLASGAASYSWTPAPGLNSTTIQNPTASPTVTTRYRVVGYDGFNCFTDTAFITVGVGQYPTVNLGPDLTLAAGTQQPLISRITNGPIANWNWTPATDLSCASCPLPILNVKKDGSYIVRVTTAYGCPATDTLNVKVFCESAQVFIPNAFTPDDDGINDILMVRGKGVAMVKSFRIFNRWGEVVFERANFPANNPAYGWNGKIRGVAGGPDVFVYTADVMCENGSSFTYKGNVSLLK